MSLAYQPQITPTQRLYRDRFVAARMRMYFARVHAPPPADVKCRCCIPHPVINQNVMTAKDVIDLVAYRWGLLGGDLISSSRKAKFMKARFAAALLLKETLSAGPRSIGKHLGGRDHTTASYEIARAEELLNTDLFFEWFVSNIREDVYRIWLRPRRPSMSDLFSYTSARTSDPETSHAAAATVGRFAGEHHQRILAALREAGRPMAAEEIADVKGFKSHVPVNRRLGELASIGMVASTDERHLNRSGRRAVKYRPAEAVRSRSG